jgi:hypothetical protein
MSESLRGFRYQTGEIKEIAKKLKKGEIVQVDIDIEREIDEVINDLKNQGIYKIKDMPYDYKALDGEKEPEFEMRVGFYRQEIILKQAEKDKIMYIDFFHINEEEDAYGQIW